MTISAAADSATAATNQFFGAQGLDHVLTAVGLLLCLAGGLVVNYGARLLAGGVGLGLGFALGAVMATVIKLTDDQTAIALLATSLTGAVAGLIAAKAVSTLVFGATGLLFGGLLGRVAAETWARRNGATTFAVDGQVLAVMAGAGVIGALGALWLKKAIVIVVTAFAGATFLAAGMPWLEARAPDSVLWTFVGSVAWQSGLAMRMLRRKS